jgi:hypothetical protein
MAGYAKIWTDCFQDDWFVSMNSHGRGLWLQLIVWAKLQGDTGTICFRSWGAAAMAWGCDDQIAAKYVAFFASTQKCELIKTKNCITIKILNYQYYQEVDAKEHIKKRKQRCEKSRRIFPLPDQTRPDQTILSKGTFDHKEAIDYFCQKYQEKTKEKYIFDGGKDGKIVKGLLKSVGLEKFKILVDRMFETDDPFIKDRAGYSISILKACANKLIQAKPSSTQQLTELNAKFNKEKEAMNEHLR